MSNHRIFGIAALLVVGCSSAPRDAQQDDGSTGESEDHLLAGRRLSEQEIASLLRDAGFPESSVGQLVCTAKYESSFYERASHTNGNGSTDYGLFQINSVHLGDAGCPRTASALDDAATNTRCAYHVWRSQGIRAWYGYQKHRAECDRYAVASGAGGGGTLDPYAEEDAGSCWSATLEDMERAGTCVQSKFDGAWYQCSGGRWHPGGSDGAGPYGACASSHSL